MLFNGAIGQEADEDEGESDGKAKRLGFGGPAESDEHRRLKEYVANNPKTFSAPRGCSAGKMEKRLETFDEIDVWFMNPSEELAVEVKSTKSNDLDIKRGLFQCVKYRAVLEAQLRIANSSSKVRTRLVSERKLTLKLAKWADVLAIEVQVIKPLTSSK
jgi:Holliday junction resolvase